MSNLYDDALVNKLRKWIKDDSIKITSPNETRRLFEYKADTTNDEPLQLPLIALRKDTTMTILSTNKKPMTFDGYRKNNNGQKSDQVNAVPINISYQIDIYTRYEEEADEYIRNFVFNIINYPKLVIEIPYNNAKITHISNIRMQPDVNDNSDIPERMVAGQFTRKTIGIYIDDAYLWDYRVKDTKSVEYTTSVELDKITEIDV